MKLKVTKVELNRQGVKDLLKSNEVMSALEENAPILGDVDTKYIGVNRARVVVNSDRNTVEGLGIDTKY